MLRMSLPSSIIKWTSLWLGLLLALTASPARAQSKEYQVKAAFLVHFTQFIEWPPAAFPTTNSPFCLGVLGEDPFGAALDDMIQSEAIGSHKLTVQRSRRLADLKNCQLIFISKSEKNHWEDILSALGSSPVLTVSETRGFAERGGDINFYLEGAKIRFEINPSAAQHAGLKISSQLLTLGKIIQPPSEVK